MKKMYLVLLVAFFSLTNLVCAQSSLLATLSHNGEISTYYGTKAFIEAYNASVSGDVITLSSGNFAGTTIKKGITIRGVGMERDTLNQILPTILSNIFHIDIPDSEPGQITVEGIQTSHLDISKANSPVILKCKMESVSAACNKPTFIHCIFEKRIDVSYGRFGSIGTTCEFHNCYIANPSASGSGFFNCVLDYSSPGSSPFDLGHSTRLMNCAIISSSSQSGLTDIQSVYNCISNVKGMFDRIPNQSNLEFDGPIFKENGFYELLDEVKNMCKGTDGTEVGLYGGALPFDPVPTNPLITKCKVASKSTADGKLSVDIEVKAAE